MITPNNDKAIYEKYSKNKESYIIDQEVNEFKNAFVKKKQYDVKSHNNIQF